MDERLTEEDFLPHVHTKFRIRTESPVEAELELASVVPYQGGAGEESGMVRFSLFFEGPASFLLQQGMFTLEHEQLGTLLIFLVPIGKTEEGFRYEAVFNYFKE